MHGEHGLELRQVRLYGRGHVGVLQLDRQEPPVVRHRLMHLPERCRRRGVRVEALKARPPIGTELHLHPALREGGAHGGRGRLQLDNSRAYSGGSASGMVESSCATFIKGPLRPPSAAARSAALRALSCSMPKRRPPAMRAATAPTLVPRARSARPSPKTGCPRRPSSAHVARADAAALRHIGAARPANKAAIRSRSDRCLRLPPGCQPRQRGRSVFGNRSLRPRRCAPAPQRDGPARLASAISALFSNCGVTGKMTSRRCRR